ncbi:unnamed protein product [Pleuronectes platessa]|uniref:Uncharacterized protein n=1 Tax=Pleuronectes platessa TaxID=8262 RepID=A0A9N7YS08_PLEPL|nr:unnamed protein product [Pleuronectes platessa]
MVPDSSPSRSHQPRWILENRQEDGRRCCEAERTHFICTDMEEEEEEEEKEKERRRRRRRRRNVFFIFRRTPPHPAHTSTPTSTSKAAWTSKESERRETKVKRQLHAQPAVMAASPPLSSHSVASMNGNCCVTQSSFFCRCGWSRTTGRRFVLAGINRSIDDAHPARPLRGRPAAQQPSSPGARPGLAPPGPSSGPRSLQGRHGRRAAL